MLIRIWDVRVGTYDTPFQYLLSSASSKLAQSVGSISQSESELDSDAEVASFTSFELVPSSGPSSQFSPFLGTFTKQKGDYV